MRESLREVWKIEMEVEGERASVRMVKLEEYERKERRELCGSDP